MFLDTQIFQSLYNFICTLAWRIQIGPINDEMAIIINCIHQSVVMFGSMNLSEIMIYKVKNTFTKDSRILISQNVKINLGAI